MAGPTAAERIAVPDIAGSKVLLEPPGALPVLLSKIRSGSRRLTCKDDVMRVFAVIEAGSMYRKGPSSFIQL